jgi:hypothetical protein
MKLLALGSLAITAVTLVGTDPSRAVPANGPLIAAGLADISSVEQVRVFCYNTRTGAFNHRGTLPRGVQLLRPRRLLPQSGLVTGFREVGVFAAGLLARLRRRTQSRCSEALRSRKRDSSCVREGCAGGRAACRSRPVIHEPATADRAARHGIPAIYEVRPFAVAGA